MAQIKVVELKKPCKCGSTEGRAMFSNGTAVVQALCCNDCGEDLE